MYDTQNCVFVGLTARLSLVIVDPPSSSMSFFTPYYHSHITIYNVFLIHLVSHKSVLSNLNTKCLYLSSLVIVNAWHVYIHTHLHFNDNRIKIILIIFQLLDIFCNFLLLIFLRSLSFFCSLLFSSLRFSPTSALLVDSVCSRQCVFW